MSSKLIVSSSPHIRNNENVKRIMTDVVIALLPATIYGIYQFGLRALLVVVLCIASSVVFEALFQKLTGQKITVLDMSAVVTGLLLALNLPPTVPVYIPVLGSLFAIVIVKQLFGGLGHNFMNPALAARAFLLISFAKHMTTWVVDGVSGATPLGLLNENLPIDDIQIIDLFTGNIGGCIGETSAICLLIGGAYLLLRRVICWRIPVTYIATVAVLIGLLGRNGFDINYIAFHLFSGGLFLGAFFMATDYVSSPVTKTGKIIMGLGCGLLTVLIRLYGSYPEGVSFAILIMNLFVPLIDRYTIPRAFGEVSKE